MQGLIAYESVCASSEPRYRGMQHSHYELKVYLKCERAENKAEHQSLVRNVAYEHLQRGQIGWLHFVIRGERG